MIEDTNSMTDMGVPFLAEQVTDLRKRLAENKRVIDGFSNYVRQAALSSPSQLESVIRTITAERDKAETETLLLERELANKENQLCELKSENQDKGMRDHLEKLLENFDSQEDLKKRDIIQLIIPKTIVRKGNKLELWVRRELGTPTPQSLRNKSSCGSVSDFGHEGASYQPPVGMEKNGLFNFLKTEESGDCLVKPPLPLSGVSHLEESGSSEFGMAGYFWTTLTKSFLRLKLLLPRHFTSGHDSKTRSSSSRNTSLRASQSTRFRWRSVPSRMRSDSG